MPIDFNDDILRQIRPVMEYILLSIAIASLILDIAICKWRKLVNVCLYLESLYLTATAAFGTLTLQPNSSNLVMAMANLMFFVIFYCQRGGQIIFCCVNTGLFSFIVLPVIYNESLTIQTTLVKVIVILVQFIVCSSLAMLLSYILKLHARM